MAGSFSDAVPNFVVMLNKSMKPYILPMKLFKLNFQINHQQLPAKSLKNEKKHRHRSMKQTW